jgi:hypothetical protein
MGRGKSRCDIPNGTTRGQDCLENVSNNQRKWTILGEALFEKFEV